MNKFYLLGFFFLIFFTAFLWQKCTNKENKFADIADSRYQKVEKPKVLSINSAEKIIPELGQRDRKVLEKLEEFKRKTADITVEKVSFERERIRKNLMEIKERKLLEPQKEILVDDDGEVWEKLDYGEGIIRYNFATGKS